MSTHRALGLLAAGVLALGLSACNQNDEIFNSAPVIQQMNINGADAAAVGQATVQVPLGSDIALAVSAIDSDDDVIQFVWVVTHGWLEPPGLDAQGRQDLHRSNDRTPVWHLSPSDASDPALAPGLYDVQIVVSDGREEDTQVATIRATN